MNAGKNGTCTAVRLIEGVRWFDCTEKENMCKRYHFYSIVLAWFYSLFSYDICVLLLAFYLVMYLPLYFYLYHINLYLSRCLHVHFFFCIIPDVPSDVLGVGSSGGYSENDLLSNIKGI